MTKVLILKSAVILMFAAGSTVAFDGHIVTEGPLRLAIGNIENVTELGTPYDVQVIANNTGTAPLTVEVRLADLVDEWHAIGRTEKQLSIEPGERATAIFQIAAGKGALSALYPIHVYAAFSHAGQMLTAHAVRIFESQFEKAIRSSVEPPSMPVNVVPADGALPLWRLRTHRVTWCYYDQPLVYMPVGWQGSAPQSLASFSVHPVARGVVKDAITMHPPWKPGGGTIFAEYLLKLPDAKPIKLLFANAIRDHTASEPPSDGVTFRVWIGQERLFERHTDSKKWLDGEVDLSRFAGQEILLRLESHPGPRRDTTCDSSYWGEPVVVAGTLPPQVSDAERERLRQRARELIDSQKDSGDGEFLFRLEGGYLAALVLGDAGLADGAIAFGRGSHCVVFDGLSVSVLGDKIGRGPSPIALRKVNAQQDRLSGRLSMRHRLLFADEEFDLTAQFWQEKGGLRIRLACPKRITDMGLGRADQKAPRVYYGHGYCIVEPEAFRADFGGHNLSTSHVGFEFAEGISLLVASDNPPDYLEVDPEQRIYSLHTHLDATMTFVPSTDGAFDCAKKYQPLFDKNAASAVARKAGRFVFDIWGGRYTDIAETMKRMVSYGLTDSLLTVHVWQRWGYDYRLPDIYPPQPQLGTIEDMQQIAEVCAEHDIPWGLHDNYIDFYPDAADYGYDHICFTEQGEPIRAWLNTGRDAQSYRWRPDHIMPFIQRNLRLIEPTLKPTHYFIDVFTSIPCFDFYDKQGNFHSMLETRQSWGEAFAWIREFLGGDVPMTSEAGHDQLIGYLDGSDCQHLQLSPVAERFCIKLSCQDWERVPWFDAVLHDKFSLHGVGYPSRYKLAQPGSGQRVLESDDYISAEVLEGHAMMIDRGGFGRGAVRKYWLAQDFVRSIALDSINDVQFADGDIRRQIVTWSSGAKVYVNRGSADWHVADKILPQYGYLAKNGQIESSIEKLDGVTVEQSRGPSRWYVNARGFSPEGTLAVRPMAAHVEYLGGRKFRMTVSWEVWQAAPKDLDVFIHFSADRARRRDKIAFQSGGTPTPGTSRWEGRVVTGENWLVQIPADCGAGKYDVTVGLWDPSTGRRYRLLADDDGALRYHLGKLMVEEVAGNITNVRLVKHQAKPEPQVRWNLKRVPVDFGPVVTAGAVRCELKKDAIVVTPLPEMEPFTVGIRIDRLIGADRVAVKSVIAVDSAGKNIRHVDFKTKANMVEFHTSENGFAYHLLLGRQSP